MAEKSVKFWVCDWCGREARRGLFTPSGWYESVGLYSNTAHSCPDDACREGIRDFCNENGFELPWQLRG